MLPGEYSQTMSFVSGLNSITLEYWRRITPMPFGAMSFGGP